MCSSQIPSCIHSDDRGTNGSDSTNHCAGRGHRAVPGFGHFGFVGRPARWVRGLGSCSGCPVLGENEGTGENMTAKVPTPNLRKGISPKPPGTKPSPPPALPPRKPRFPFCVYVNSIFSNPKCQLCKASCTSKRPGRHSRFPEMTNINAVGPFKICDECVVELDEALGHGEQEKI